MKQHQDAMRASRSELAKEPTAGAVIDMQAEAKKARIQTQEQARTAHKAQRYSNQPRAAAPVFDMQAEARKARAQAQPQASEPVIDMQAEARKARAVA